MASYKDAIDIVNQSGGGLDTLQQNSFKEFITNNICKYYYEIDSVLKDRPNVRPWYTNKDRCIEIDDSNDSSDSDDSIESFVEHDNATITCTKMSVSNRHLTDSDITDSKGSIKLENTACSFSSSQRNLPFASSTTSQRNTPPENIGVTDDSSSHHIGLSKYNNSESPRKRKDGTKGTKLISPIEAKKRQKEVVKKKKKSIASKRGKNMLTSLSLTDQEDCNLMQKSTEAKMDFDKKSSEAKMNFEKQKHINMKELEREKISIEKRTPSA
jgi:hypothetical protein